VPVQSRTSRSNEGLRPKKRLGQHFLSNRGVVEKILSRARFAESDVVLEVGPGQGALTLPLARQVSRVIAVEKDERLISVLEEKLERAGISNVDLIHADILRFDFYKAQEGSRFQVIGNLPYNISSPFLEKLVENRRLVQRAVLMFQLEVAKRLTAEPGSKDYGALTLGVRYFAHPSVLLSVSKGSFYPVPKVDSMVLELDFSRPFPRRAPDEEHFKRVVKAAFAHRRKTVLNSLSVSGLNRDGALHGLGLCGIDPGRRAEGLSMDDFLCLASALSFDGEIDK
jgi:16S rRNA (adenine1518-N6/adenine1519-N6)-dimethyltransferase